jgi:hypothetical protein
LISERDYVTALTTRIRIELSQHLSLYCHAQTVNSQNENQFGVDGIIVFRSIDKVKIGLFEAKRPQVTQHNYRWDYLTTRNLSHFSEQIEKQRIWNGKLAIWEMFFNEAQYGFQTPPYDFFGSSCVWHNNAFNFIHTENLIFRTWSTDNLKKLLKTSGLNFYSIIYDIISCPAGEITNINTDSNSFRIFSRENDNISINIPLPIEQYTERDERIEHFLIENKLNSYMYIDLVGRRKM